MGCGLSPFQRSLFHDSVKVKCDRSSCTLPFAHRKRTSEAMPGAVASFAVLYASGTRMLALPGLLQGPQCSFECRNYV